MIYQEYHEIKKRYQSIKQDFYNLMEKRARIISSVDVQASKPKEVITHINSTTFDDSLVKYAEQKEDLDNRLNILRNDKEMLEMELEKKEQLMRVSNDVYDRIYIFKWIEHRRVKEYYKLVNYSKRQVYNFINEMKIKLYKED